MGSKIEKEEVQHDSDEEKESATVSKVKSYTDIMKRKLDKLMANPDKPVFIPERPKDKDVNKCAEFNHNIMGSSAGAGSGEFHLYRQMRRKEANRQAVLGYRRMRDELNEAYHQKLEENEKAAEDRTAKKREKRQKKKANKKKKKPNNAQKKDIESEESDPDSEDDSKIQEGNKEKGNEINSSIVAVNKSTSKAEDPLMKEPPKKAPLIIQF